MALRFMSMILFLKMRRPRRKNPSRSAPGATLSSLVTDITVCPCSIDRTARRLVNRHAQSKQQRLSCESRHCSLEDFCLHSFEKNTTGL
ncbi:hypothetical protein KC322_g107 [Hortaea werneckii]|nr:hypothetical protein KC322_g107 [Hortaea werneckii]